MQNFLHLLSGIDLYRRIDGRFQFNDFSSQLLYFIYKSIEVAIADKGKVCAIGGSAVIVDGFVHNGIWFLYTIYAITPSLFSSATIRKLSNDFVYNEKLSLLITSSSSVEGRN